MTTLTIPRKLGKESDLVVIPRVQYEEFLDLKRIANNHLINKRTGDSLITRAYKLEKRKVAEGLKAIKKGQLSKSFKNAEGAIEFLRSL